MKTIIMADLHLGKFWKTNNAVISRAKKLINNYLKNLDNIINKLKGEPANLIIAGDVYDSVHNNVELLCYVKKELSKRLTYFNQKGKVYIIAGNHEIFIDKNGDQQTILTIGLDSYNNEIIGNGITHWMDNINKINYVFIPFQNNIEEILEKKVIDELSTYYKNIIIAHFTPKEMFYHGKFELNKYIDNWLDNNVAISYIILGDYHKPISYTYRNINVISVGNSYYHTIDDLRDFNSDKNKKRYIVVNDINNVESVQYNLPFVYDFFVENQNEFNNMNFSNIDKENDIIYLKSKELIDYSNLMFEGYDIYFDLIEDENNNLNNIQQSLTEAVSDNISGNTLNDRWDKYININNHLNNKEKNIATYLFNKRNDKIDNQEIFKMFESEA